MTILLVIASCAFLVWACLEAAKRTGARERKVWTILAGAFFVIGGLAAAGGIITGLLGGA